MPFEPEQYKQIWQRVCAEHSIAYDGGLVDYVIEQLHRRRHVPLLPCHPRDLARHGARSHHLPRARQARHARRCVGHGTTISFTRIEVNSANGSDQGVERMFSRRGPILIVISLLLAVARGLGCQSLAHRAGGLGEHGSATHGRRVDGRDRHSARHEDRSAPRRDDPDARGTAPDSAFQRARRRSRARSRSPTS